MTAIYHQSTLDFYLPKKLLCAKPTEERGLARDEVRLMVSDTVTNQVEYNTFKNIGDFLQAGDTLVVNTSATLKAALPIQLANGLLGRLHLSTRQNEKEWLVEVRQIIGNKTQRYQQVNHGDIFDLPDGGQAQIIEPYYGENTLPEHLHLWRIRFEINTSVETFLDQYGHPIKYDSIQKVYPASYYQTVFAQEAGSAEMPSAGRAFTTEVLTHLKQKGVHIVPILLHTGVSSLEEGEQPYPEYYSIPEASAQKINAAKARGSRIIAVGTTAIRALESAVEKKGIIQAQSGWTNLYITPKRKMQIVDGLLTGFHEPRASHLSMLEALTGLKHLKIAYRAAIQAHYYWHEFGDLHLILPPSRTV